MGTFIFIGVAIIAFIVFGTLGHYKRNRHDVEGMFWLAMTAFNIASFACFIEADTEVPAAIFMACVFSAFIILWWRYQKPEPLKLEPVDEWKEYRDKVAELASYRPDKTPALEFLGTEIPRIDHPTTSGAVQIALLVMNTSVFPSYTPLQSAQPHQELVNLEQWRRSVETFYMDVAVAFLERYRRYVADTQVPTEGDFASGSPLYPDHIVEATEEFIRHLPSERVQTAIEVGPVLRKHFHQTRDWGDETVKHYMKVLLDGFTYYASIPEHLRFEHTWVLGPPGSGKTQTIQHLITRDLNKQGSIFVMDSQGDLVRNVSTIASIQDRLLLVEPETVSVNPFDMRGESAMDLLTYVFSALGEGAEFTPRQKMLYQFGIRLMQEVPNATLLTFVDLLTNGLDPYEQYVSKLATPAQMFFRDDFRSKGLQETKDGVGWRLKLMLSDPTFERMFTRPTNFDLKRALDEGKVVVVDTDKEKLGGDRSSLFGRFMIAYLLHASQQRASQSQGERTPVYSYIDEAHEYLQDDSVATILDQARKMKIAMVLANQRSAQVKNPNMLDALMATSIKLVRTDADANLSRLAKVMHIDPNKLSALTCQSARNIDPLSASNIDPLIAMMS